MIFALDYEILRNVEANGRKKLPLARKPVRVATLLNETLFRQLGNAVKHHETVFLEDRMHDWSWENGSFRYYTRIAESADVLVIYATSDQPVWEAPPSAETMSATSDKP